jgi:hypothetical protein
MRLAALMDKAPEIQMSKLDQIPALPLGARVKVNPWNNRLTLLKSRKVAALSSREKQPFEITPVYLHLTRYSETNPTPEAANPAAQTPAGQTPATQPTTTSQVRSPQEP